LLVLQNGRSFYNKQICGKTCSRELGIGGESRSGRIPCPAAESFPRRQQTARVNVQRAPVRIP